MNAAVIRKTEWAGTTVRHTEPTPAALRTMLRALLRVIVRNRQTALKVAGANTLHDLRVALRRFRSALRLFRPALTATSAARLEKDIAALAEKLGPIRDSEVWWRFLCRPGVAARLRKTPGGTALVRRAAVGHRRQLVRLARVLSDPKSGGTLRGMTRLVQTELPALAERAGAEPFGHVAAKRLRRRLRRLRSEGRLPARASAAQVHACRKRVRKTRYAAEFAAPALGRRVARLAVRLADLADALGDLHDMDVWLARIRREPVALAAPLRRLIERNRKTAWQRHAKAWQALEGATR